MLGGFRRWSATHVPRAQNSTADRLANEALDRVAAGGPMRDRPRPSGGAGGVGVFTIVCYGDSNTHGAHPVTGGRWPRDVRWPGVLAADVADLADVVEEGLSGRTTLWDDPFMDGRNGQPYLLPCLRSHAPVDLVVLMLGTNDLKTIFGRQAHEIALGAGTLADMALGSGHGPGRRGARASCSSRRRASAS